MPAGTEIARWVIAALVVIVLAVASASDVKARHIPNWTVIAIAGLYVVWAATGPIASILSSLGAGALVLAVTAGLFAFGVIGAGDSKLMAAIALFAGFKLLLFFVLATVLFGGALAVFTLALQPRRALAMLRLRGQGDFGRGIPYGVAISMAGALVLLHQLSCNAADAQFVCF